MRRISLRTFAFGLTSVIAGATLGSAGGAGPASAWPSARMAPASAGDYVAIVKISALGTASVGGEIDQLVGGAGTPQRVANFHASSAGTVVTALVRVTGPSDVFRAVTWGPSTVGSFSFTRTSLNDVVRGTKLTTPTNADVILHGVNGNDLMTIPTDISTLYSWTNARVVRVLVNECQWLPYFKNAYSPAYRQQVISTVAAATASGGTAILDLHYACHDDPAAPVMLPYTSQIGPDTHSVAFWADAASLFGNNPSVMFELFNEPKMGRLDIEPDGHTGAQTWRDGGQLQAGTATWYSPGMQALYDTVRASGANNLVLIDGTGWASNLLTAGTNPVDGTNIAYAFHAYAPAGTDPSVYPANLDRSVAPVIDPNGRYREAGFATEFGTNAQDTPAAATGSSYLASTIAWLDAHHVGWAVYGWYPRTIDSYGLLTWWPLWGTSRTQPVLAAF